MESLPVYQWSTMELCQYLEENGVQMETIEIFRKLKFSGRTFLYFLDQEEMNELKITYDDQQWIAFLIKKERFCYKSIFSLLKDIICRPVDFVEFYKAIDISEKTISVLREKKYDTVQMLILEKSDIDNFPDADWNTFHLHRTDILMTRERVKNYTLKTGKKVQFWEPVVVRTFMYSIFGRGWKIPHFFEHMTGSSLLYLDSASFANFINYDEFLKFSLARYYLRECEREFEAEQPEMNSDVDIHVTGPQDPREFDKPVTSSCKYVTGYQFNCFESDRENPLLPIHEFKLCNTRSRGKPVDSSLLSQKVMYDVLRFSGACLNKRQNATIHFGIADEKKDNAFRDGFRQREVVGVALPPDFITFFLEYSKNCIHQSFKPEVAHLVTECIRDPKFVPLYTGNTPTGRVVIEVDIIPTYSCTVGRMFLVKPPNNMDVDKKWKVFTAFIRGHDKGVPATKVITNASEFYEKWGPDYDKRRKSFEHFVVKVPQQDEESETRSHTADVQQSIPSLAGKCRPTSTTAEEVMPAPTQQPDEGGEEARTSLQSTGSVTSDGTSKSRDHPPTVVTSSANQLADLSTPSLVTSSSFT